MMNGDQPMTDDTGAAPGSVPQRDETQESMIAPTADAQPTSPPPASSTESAAAPTADETAGGLSDAASPTAPGAENVAAPVDMAPPTDTAPAAESTGVDNSHMDAAPTTEPSTESNDAAADGEPSKRRVQLNPTVAPEDARAVPTYNDGSTDPVTGMDPMRFLQPGSAGPVEVPREATLESELEAEINAAMSGAMAASASTEPTDAAGGSSVGPVPASEDQLEPGSKLKAKVQSVSSENVFCEIGFRAPGLLPVKQFPPGKQPREGEEFLVVVDKYDAENGVVMVSLPKATRRPKGNWEDLAVGQIVECVVNKTNKGGLEVTVSNMRAFLPASQVDVGFAAALDQYVGQRFAVQITEVNPAKRNLVVSRRALVIQERKEAAANFWGKVEVGQQYAGTVKTIKDYGAFVDLGGVDGFLHVGEMSWTRIKHPSDLLQEGQPIDVVVLSLDREKHKIGLGMRQLAQNPWNTAVDKYAVGTTASGKVTRVSDFGAFVELEPGVEGLIHISELDHRRVKRVTEVLNVGQDVQAQVLEVIPDRQRISLSLKSLKPKPEEPKDEDLAPNKGQAYERKRKEPLRGGTGTGMSGGLFGNPGDFTTK